MAFECRCRRAAWLFIAALPSACAVPDDAPSSGGGAWLPFACGARATVTQGNHTAFNHQGAQAWAYDFGVARGTPVMAMASGTVTHAASAVTPGGRCWNGGGSECAATVNHVVVAHDDGASTLYLHLDAAEVPVGARVARGQRIGRSGNTGWSAGAHLHVQRQVRCAGWFCESLPLRFVDAEVPVLGATVTSGNCP